jgi:ribosomal protein S18 acetylase RimI-like enzyme
VNTTARIRREQDALPNRKESAGARSKVSTSSTAPSCGLQSQRFRRNPSSLIEQNRHVDQPTRASLFATEVDASSIAALRTAAAAHLTRTFGQGHWSRVVTERAVRSDLRTSRVLAARRGPSIVATMALATKKPWAIDLAYFTPVPRALYLHEMAVAPELQRQGIGRDLVREAIAVAKAWPSQSIRLDAYDAAAGAGGFYATCGFREVGRVTYRNVPLIYFELLL